MFSTELRSRKGAEMSKLSDANIIKEFQEFDIQLEYGSNKLDKRECFVKLPKTA